MRLLIGIVAFLVWSGGSAYWYVCKVKGLCPEEVLPTIELAEEGNVEEKRTKLVETRPEGEDIDKEIEALSENSTTETETETETEQESDVGPERVRSNITEKYTILFAYAQPILTNEDEANQYMKDLASYIADHPGSKVWVTGFTDDTAAKERNKVLGKKRAKVIADLLESQGVPRGSIEIESLGEANPVATNETPAGRKLNRRVEITLQSK